MKSTLYIKVDTTSSMEKKTALKLSHKKADYKEVTIKTDLSIK